MIRIVGLSATPGTTADAVSEVIQNLNISKLEFRTDQSPDVAKYTNKKDVECISVKLSDAILNIRSRFLVVSLIQEYLNLYVVYFCYLYKDKHRSCIIYLYNATIIIMFF